jgi:NTE family protein
MNNISTSVLVLSGGAAKGAYQAGAMLTLQELGVTYQFISGVSVGALNASMLATDRFNRLVELWEQTRQKDIMRHRGWVPTGLRWVGHKIGITKPPEAFYDTEKLRKLIRSELKGKRVIIPFSIGTVDLGSGRYHDIRFEAGHTLTEDDCNMIYASAAIPVLFDPVRTRKELWVDGGVRNITPLEKAVLQDPDLVVIIPTEPYGDPHGERRYSEVDPGSLRAIDEIGLRSLDVLLNEIFREDIKRFLTVNYNVLQHREALEELGAESPGSLTNLKGRPLKYFEPVLIDPEESLGSGMDFSRESFEKRFAAGQKDARKAWENRADSTPDDWIADREG